jgi:hypothetical protein
VWLAVLTAGAKFPAALIRKNPRCHNAGFSEGGRGYTVSISVVSPYAQNIKIK